MDADLLQVVLRATTVHVSQDEAHRIRLELRGAEAAGAVLSWHNDLASIVADESRFRRMALPASMAARKPGGDLGRARSIAALTAALEQELALFADDRYCQAHVLNTRGHDTSAPFRTDVFIAALLNEDKILVSEAARHFRQLADWRYRLLVPPAGVLAHFAREYMAKPPGTPLAAVANYMHDCMRDPGLFAGPEPTNPPLPLAFHYWQAWR